MTAEDEPKLPLGLRITFAFVLAFLAAFVLTAPWRVAGLEIGRLSPALWVAFVLSSLALLFPPWRRALVRLFRDRDIRFGRRLVLVGALASALFLGRVLLSRYAALDVNAWDTGLFADTPIAETLVGRPLFCSYTGRSYLGSHATYLLFAFVPLYALVSSPLWLLGAEAAAIGVAAALAFLLFRRILEDDLSAGFLAFAFLLNSYTAKTLQYGFHAEAFYPLALFLLLYAHVSRRRLLFTAAVLLAVSIKEDALLPLAGFAVAAAWDRRWRPAAFALAGGLVAFLAGTFVVMPHFSGDAPGHPWYSFYWSGYGDTPLKAAGSIASHPLRVASDLTRSGLPDLFEPLLALPLAGFRWLAAAAPALLLFAVASHSQLSHFGLYYSASILPFLFAGTAEGLVRVTGFRSAGLSPRRLRLRRRVGALLVLLVCALDGSGYRFARAHPARREVGAVVASLGGRPVGVQGSLFLRAARLGHVDVLRPDRPLSADEAVLLAPDTNPYPYSSRELSTLIHSLSTDSRYEKTATPGGLLLFTPRP